MAKRKWILKNNKPNLKQQNIFLNVFFIMRMKSSFLLSYNWPFIEFIFSRACHSFLNSAHEIISSLSSVDKWCSSIGSPHTKNIIVFFALNPCPKTIVMSTLSLAFKFTIISYHRSSSSMIVLESCLNSLMTPFHSCVSLHYTKIEMRWHFQNRRNQYRGSSFPSYNQSKAIWKTHFLIDNYTLVTQHACHQGKKGQYIDW